MPPNAPYAGPLLALFAFLAWGLLPAYWKALSAFPSLEILCHRVVWSLVVVLAALLLTGRMGEARAALKSRREALLLLTSSLIVSLNWFVYIWAVNAGHVVEASLGYYINPLVNVLLGRIVFRERLRRAQFWAVLLACAGVLNLVLAHGRLPWIALTLALSFGVYGMIRKLVGVQALPGLFVETLVLGLPAAGFLIWLAAHGQGGLGHAAPATQALLLGAGVVTAAPLAAFAAAARRMRLASVGIIQYLAPTCMFLLGVLAYGEPFVPAQAVTFALIWSGIALYCADAVSLLRRTPSRG